MNAKWTNEHTGDGKTPSRQLRNTKLGNLFVWGTGLGITQEGRTLFCMKDVAITGGDEHVDEQVMTYQ
jgi:hypothetical protein